MSQPSSSYSRPIPAGGFELVAWWFMRVSGLVLVFLALGHLVIMHIINHIDDVNYAFVAARWATPFWRTYDWVMLVLALFHGMNGARVIVDDYAKGMTRTFWHSLLWVLTLVLIGLGSVVVFTFNPVPQ